MMSRPVGKENRKDLCNSLNARVDIEGRNMQPSKHFVWRAKSENAEICRRYCERRIWPPTDGLIYRMSMFEDFSMRQTLEWLIEVERTVTSPAFLK